MSTTDILARVRTLLEYDQATGVFRWRDSRHRVMQGMVAGGLAAHGYWRVTVDGRTWWSHRLAWFYVYGEVPGREVDHIDGNRANNAIANLRLATRRQNQINKPAKNGSSGIRGVTRSGVRWRAAIRVNGRSKHLGVFDTPEEASAAYVAASTKHHGEFAYAPRPLA